MGDRRRVLLLGSTGFIGRHVSDALEAAGDEVLGLARNRRRTRPSWRELDLVVDDLASAVADARSDVVVNCAGRTHGSASELVAANVQVVARLLDALSTRPTRLVHLGSSAEYGRGGVRPTREDASAEPVGTYGVTKLAATGLVRASELDAIVLRVFNPVGAGMTAESMPGRAAILIRAAKDAGDRSIRMGDLSAERDFVDVRDVAAAVVAATHTPEVPRLINVGSGRATRARDLVRLLADVAGFDGEIGEQASGSDRSAGVDRQIADITTARENLAWEPVRSLRDALSALWAAVEP